MPPNPCKECFCCKCCFGISTLVTLQGGVKKPMHELKEGEKILSINENGQKEFTEVYIQTHRDVTGRAKFCEISTFSKRLRITPRHFVLVKDGKCLKNKMAKEVKIGDIVMVVDDDDQLKEESVLTTDIIEGTGYINYLTMSGRLIADGVLCSTYAEVKPSIAHKLSAPIRAAYKNTITKGAVSSLMSKKNKEGKPLVLKAASSLIRPMKRRCTCN